MTSTTTTETPEPDVQAEADRIGAILETALAAKRQPTVKVKRTSSLGYFDVLVDGARVGEIHRYERHVNLARPFTIRGWQVAGDPTVHRTRAAALAALVAGR